MKQTSTLLALGLVLLNLPAAFAETDAARPNILYFYVDDMGWGSLGPNGQIEHKENGRPYLLTPTLDKLAAEGVNFTRAYGCTVCSPARSSQQSGFHQGHTFADRNDPDNAKKAMRADDVLIGDALSEAGYVTGYWGKWGFGGSKNRKNPEIVNVQTLPTSHGYQHVVAELHHVRAHTFFQPTLWKAPAATRAKGGLELMPNSMTEYADNSAYPNSPARQNHPDYPETAYCDDVYAFAALEFVREQARNYNKTGQPFFGLVGVQIPHAPFDEIAQLPEWDAAYRDHPHFADLPDQAKHWAAMITRIDAHFGNLLAALEDPNGDGDHSDSIADNTLVIFQSDNGGPQHSARRAFAANGGLRGAKESIHEGGIRVPTLMRWPGKLSAGTESDRVIDVTDLLPTFCELAGATPPLGIDGVSQAPTLQGKGHQRERDFLIHEAGRHASIIRGPHKLIRSKSGLQLYNLETDPAEQNDIAEAHPELVRELETLLLGERVTEPKGFANTYHDWTGENGAVTSDPQNWSDYQYANEGITYLTDDGAPRLSWVATMKNAGSTPAHAKADADLEVLGLEIRGDTATHTLDLEPGVNLTGRNEIRLAANGKLSVRGGTVSSLRWLDIKPGGQLEGYGAIDATLYNRGTVSVSNRGFRVKEGYRSFREATLQIMLTPSSDTPLRVAETAYLDGSLAVTMDSDFKSDADDPITLLRAKSIDGRFANPKQRLTTDKGRVFEIDYTDSAVTITPRSE